MTKPKTIVITGCDRNHFGLAEDFVASFRAVHGAEHDLGFLRFCPTPLPDSIAQAVDHVFDGSAEYAGFDRARGFYLAFTGLKARLPDLFPGYQVYCWVDADCWIQDRATIAKMAAMAGQFDLCIHPEYDVHYRFHPTPGDRSKLIYRRVYGAASLPDQPLNMPMLNAGVMGLSAGSKVWKMWADEMTAMRRRNEAGEASFYCDQIPLHRIVYLNRLNYFPLRATDNWQLYACRPGIDRSRHRLTVPTPPYEPISILHLAGTSKDMVMAKTQDGRQLTYRYRDVTAFLGTGPEG